MKHMKHMKHARKLPDCPGFTLVELMVVAVIVSLLAAVALPNYTRYTRKAARAQAKSVMLDTAQRQERYYTNNGTYVTVGTGSGVSGWQNFSGGSYGSRKYDVTTIAGALGTGSTTDLTSGFTVVGTPANQWSDPDCGTLRLDSTGQRDSNDNTQCW
jgi:type IV pilus assembly protein PilE